MASHRTFLASGEAGGAYECPKLHQGLIVRPCRATSAGQEASRDVPDLALPRGSLEIRMRRERATDDPCDIGVDELRAPLVRERGDGSRGVLADAGQLAQAHGVGRQRLVRRGASLRDVASEEMEVAGARVVAESLPCLAN